MQNGVEKRLAGYRGEKIAKAKFGFNCTEGEWKKGKIVKAEAERSVRGGK